MKRQFVRLCAKAITLAALAVSSVFGAAANPGALTITAVSTGVIDNQTNPMHVDALISVVDSKGAPVGGIPAAQFAAHTESVPGGAGCGPVLLGVKEESQLGFYTASLGIANQCSWQKGDYLIRVWVLLGSAQGQAPLKVVVTVVPPKAVQ